MLKVYYNIVFSLFLLLFLSFRSEAQSFYSSCDAEIAQAVQHKMEDFKQNYRTVDPRTGIIRNNNESLFLPGTNGKAVLLQHGFIASPFEVLSAATHLHSIGYTVYAPLLVGFGSSGKVANSVTKEQWIQDFNENVMLLKKCYSKVELVGFSIGAALALNYAFHYPENVDSLILLSPFYGFNQTMLSCIAKWTSLFTNEVSVKDLYLISGLADLRAIVKYPFFYNNTFPLNAVQEVIGLGKSVELLHSQVARGRIQTLKIPNLTIYSKYDITINHNFASQFPKTLFENSSVKTINFQERVPHQIMIPELNPHLGEILNQINAFHSKR